MVSIVQSRSLFPLFPLGRWRLLPLLPLDSLAVVAAEKRRGRKVRGECRAGPGRGRERASLRPNGKRKRGKEREERSSFLYFQFAAFAATAASSLDHPLSSFEGSRRPENKDCCKSSSGKWSLFFLNWCFSKNPQKQRYSNLKTLNYFLVIERPYLISETLLLRQSNIAKRV